MIAVRLVRPYGDCGVPVPPLGPARVQARLVGNEIFGHDKSGVQLKGGACPAVEPNLIREGKVSGKKCASLSAA